MNTSPDTARRRSFMLLLGALMALVAGILAASWLLQPGGDNPELSAGTWLPGGRPVGDFQLVDHHGERFDQERLRGQWTFLFFGYTYCPDVCPATMAVMHNAVGSIRRAHPELPLQTVFVSVDPRRDTPARLAEYVPYFDPGFLGVTGDPEQIRRLTRDLGIVYQVHEPAAGKEDYLVDHSASVLLVNPQGDLQAVFRAPHLPDALARDFQQIVD